MAQISIPVPLARRSARDGMVKERTYWGAVRAKLLRDKITVAAMLLMAFMIGISLAAPWIGNNLLGFSPTATDLRSRNKPPTWAVESWPMFQQFTQSCQAEGGASCDWSLWPAIVRSSLAGMRSCLAAGPGNCHWMGTDDAGRDVLTRGVYGGGSRCASAPTWPSSR